MNSTPSLSSGIPKPRGLTNGEWQELLYAAHTSWFTFVLDLRWLLTAAASMFAGAAIYHISRLGWDFRAVAAALFRTGFFTWGLAFLLLFRVLIASLDWSAKRKLARELHVLPLPQPSLPADPS